MSKYSGPSSLWQQELLSLGEPQGLDEWLGGRVFKNATRCSQNTQKRQYGSDANDFRERGEEHQDKEKPKQPPSMRTDVTPEAA